MATTNKQAGVKAVYIVISPLSHDGKDYELDSEVDLTEAQAKPLMPHTVKPKAADAAEK